ncbi:MAG: PaaI family thioesterase [Desulfovibrio sp.]|jgi:uncharacterized domain 1|nr:PaaI family thioesterase [Desulfovibrio sp.]
MDVDKNYITKHDKLLRLMQMKIEEATPEYARVTMPLLEQHKNGMGVAHGGAIFALADVAFGAASNADRDCGVVNMMSSIEYLRPGRVGPLMAEARAVRIGGHIANYDVQIFDGEGALIARAIVSGYLTDVPLPG